MGLVDALNAALEVDSVVSGATGAVTAPRLIEAGEGLRPLELPGEDR